MNRDDFPAPRQGIALTQFIVAKDISATVRFYTEILGGELLHNGPPAFVKLANSWIIINSGGGPTPDKPSVTLAAPADPSTTSAFMNIRVTDIHEVYRDWQARGAEFLTPPWDNHGWELRCYMRDPDGRIIEVGQATGILDVLAFDDEGGSTPP